MNTTNNEGQEDGKELVTSELYKEMSLIDLHDFKEIEVMKLLKGLTVQSARIILSKVERDLDRLSTIAFTVNDSRFQ